MIGVEDSSSGGHNWIDTLTSKTERQARKSENTAVLDFASGLPQEGVGYCRRGSSPSTNSSRKSLTELPRGVF